MTYFEPKKSVNSCHIFIHNVKRKKKQGNGNEETHTQDDDLLLTQITKKSHMKMYIAILHTSMGCLSISMTCLEAPSL